jgi:signal transduction histidine kinase
MATVLVAALLTVLAVGLVVAQQVTLTAALDANLERRADGLAAQFELGGVPGVLPGSGDDDAAQLVDASGVVVAASENLGDAGPLTLDPGGRAVMADTVVPALEDDTFRIRSQPITIDGTRYVLHVAAAHDDVSDSVRVLAVSLAIAVPLVVILLAVVASWLVGRALAPVEAIRAEAESVGPGRLDHRVPVPATGDEIAALARTMNAMLERIESGVERRQAFVADASHELRSPLTRIRSELEVDLADPARADLLATHRSVLAETVELERLISDLLYLARGDAGELAAASAPLDLDDLVFREVERARGAADIDVDTSAVSGAQVAGDPAQLSRAIRNLIDNATRHARSRVRVGLREVGAAAVLTVEDDGLGIPPDLADRIFERFARVDESRARSEGGTGLGLAITADIVHRHAGTIEVQSPDGGGSRFVMTLPTDGGGIDTDHREPPDP